MERWVGKVVIVSGASSGIGAAAAKALVIAGMKVVGLARNTERFQSLIKDLESIGKNKNFFTFKCDISSEEDVLTTLNWVNTNLGGVDVLINNAATYDYEMSLMGGTTESFREALDTNLLGTIVMTREVVQSMIKRKVDGHIIFLNSVLGHYVPKIPGLRFNVYGVTKHGLTAYTETLRQEFVEQKIKIKLSSLSPGNVHTNISPIHAKAHVNEAPNLEPEDCANAILYMLSTPPHVQIQEIIIRPVLERF